MLNSKNFVIVLISSNKHFFVYYTTPLITLGSNESPPDRFVWILQTKFESMVTLTKSK